MITIGKDSVSLEMLQEQIKATRNKMQQLGDERGYADAQVLKVSVELDNLLNEYQRRTGWLFFPKERSNVE